MRRPFKNPVKQAEDMQRTEEEDRSKLLLSGATSWDEAALNLLCELTGGPEGVETGRSISTKERIEIIKKYLKEACDIGKGKLTR
ncbi:MAG: hypothetical protein C4586_08760 [Anaerolineaceae bacterium]|nr:MAG: hypothetical protein C4586_08760 [Anaerolineaceae bacterium]